MGISPTSEYLDKQFFSMNLIHDPFYTFLTWVKPIDTRSPQIEQIREYKTKHFISPIMFGGVTSDVSIQTPSASDRKLSGIAVEPLLKFRVTFAEEDSVQPHTVPDIVLSTARKFKRQTDWPRPHTSAVSGLISRRARFLAKRFPVTRERTRLFPPINSSSRH